MSQLNCNGIAVHSETSPGYLKNRIIPSHSNLNAASKLAAGNMNWLIYLLYSRNDYTLCQQLITQQFETNYNHEYLYYIQGLIEQKSQNYVKSIQLFEKSIKLNITSNNYLYYKEIGKNLFHMKKMKQALNTFLNAEQIMVKHKMIYDIEIYYYIAIINYNSYKAAVGGKSKNKTFNLNEIKEKFHNVIGIHNSSINLNHLIDSYEKLAEIYLSENNIKKAVELLESLLLIMVENDSKILINILTKLSILYLKVNEPKNAYDKLLRVLKIDERNFQGLLAIGAILQTKNDIEGALNRYKLINEILNEGPEIWSNIGLCLYRKQKFIGAISCLKKSLWLAPLNFNIIFNLGLVLLSAQQYTSAFHTFATAINIRTSHAESYMYLGISLYYLNDLKNANLAFEHSIMLPDAIKNSLIYLNYTIFCFHTGNMSQSKLYLDNFFKLREVTHISKDNLKMGEKLDFILNSEDRRHAEQSVNTYAVGTQPTDDDQFSATQGGEINNK